VFVQKFDGTLETSELHHSVGNLSEPQWDETLVEAGETFSAVDLGSDNSEKRGAAGLSLCADLAGFKGTKSNVSEEFGRGGSGQIQRGTVQESILVTDQIGVEDLEDFVEAELANTLGRVTDSSWGPATSKTTETFLSHRHTEAGGDVLILGSIDLKTALDQIEGREESMSGAAGDETTESTQSVILV